MTMANLRSVCVATALCLFACMPRIAPAQDLESLRSAEVAQRALPRAPQLPRSAFLENRTLAAAQLSPAGDFVAYLREQKDSRALWLLPANGGSPRMLVGNTQAEQVTWSRDGRWLFLRAPRSLTMVGVDGRTGVRVPLGGNERRQVIKLDPSQTAALLLRERRVVGQSDVRWRRSCAWMRMASAPCYAKTRAGDTTWRWMCAGGSLRWRVSEGDHDALYRVLPNGALREVLRLRPMERIELLAVQADGSLLMVGNPGTAAGMGNVRRVMRLGADDKLQTLHQIRVAKPISMTWSSTHARTSRWRRVTAAPSPRPTASAVRRMLSLQSCASSPAVTSHCGRPAAALPRTGW